MKTLNVEMGGYCTFQWDGIGTLLHRSRCDGEMSVLQSRLNCSAIRSSTERAHLLFTPLPQDWQRKGTAVDNTASYIESVILVTQSSGHLLLHLSLVILEGADTQLFTEKPRRQITC